MYNFDSVYEQFVKDYGQLLLSVREDSKWHREENVMEHTRMTLAWYDNNLALSRSSRQIKLVKIALLFHDVGKPRSRTEKFSEERGVYFSYPGHEKVSAKLFESFYYTYPHLFNFETIQEMLVVRSLIEYHLPYDLQKIEKISNLKLHLNHLTFDIDTLLFDVLRSDANGRITDDMIGTNIRLEEWIGKYKATSFDFPIVPAGKKTAYILIGASGSGKSTFAKNQLEPIGELKTNYFSLDKSRLEFLQQAVLSDHTLTIESPFTYAIKNSAEFDKFAMAEYNKLLSDNISIIVDNTNTSVKSRRKWITAAKHKGYCIHAFEFLNSLETLVSRQSTREPSKAIPDIAVQRQYFAMASPLLGSEVDIWEIIP
jgi:predicted kinase/CRISPR/Cas system-associated endonuclease Cas3-HD